MYCPGTSIETDIDFYQFQGKVGAQIEGFHRIGR